MSRVCPECGREYFGQTVKCIHCNIPLVEKSDTGAAQQAQGRTSQQTRQTAAQLNYQKVQQARADQERARQQQIEQLQAQQQTKLMAQKQARNKKKQGIPMKTWKLVSGILSIVMFIFVMFQSCAAGAYNALSDNGEISGSAGAMVAIMLLVGGIVSIACRKGGKGGNIAIAILYGIGAFIGTILAGSYTDLKVWSFWCLVCMLLAIISASGAGKAGIIAAVSLGCVWLIFALFSGNPSGTSSGNSVRGTGSGSSSDHGFSTDRNSDTEGNARTESEIEENMQLKEEIIYQDQNIIITYKGISGEEDEYDFNIIVENLSDRTIEVQTRETSVNGFMVDPWCSIEVSPNKKANGRIGIKLDDAENNPKSSVSNVETKFHIFDWDDDSFGYDTGFVKIE